MIEEFLRESNAIEGVTDDAALVDATRAWTRAKEYEQISFGMVMEIHLLLLENINEDIAGLVRDVEVVVGGKPVTPVDRVRDQLRMWVEEAQMFEPELCDDIEGWIKEMHVKFEKIHPFEDGNGRTGRIILNWMRAKYGLPILVIKAANRGQYYKWFE